MRTTTTITKGQSRTREVTIVAADPTKVTVAAAEVKDHPLTPADTGNMARRTTNRMSIQPNLRRKKNRPIKGTSPLNRASRILKGGQTQYKAGQTTA